MAKPPPKIRREPAPPAGLPARRHAAELLRRVLRERRALEEVMGLSRAVEDRLGPQDTALARAIATVTLRRLGTIRAALAERLTQGNLPEGAGILVEAMETGAAQVLFMNAADHAAVDLAVEIIKRDPPARPYAKLANAILRRIAADKATILARSEAEPLDTPDWLFERWSEAYGAENARAIAAAHRNLPRIDLSAAGDATVLAAMVGGHVLPTGSVRLDNDTPVPALPGYAEGLFFVQDAAAALPARLIGARKGEKIADLCAAPGGKTAQLALAGAEVVAVERSGARAERLAENLDRLRTTARIVIADAGAFEETGFDAVLLDAPCSATGTIRRHPEVAWTKTLQDILALARQQARLLDHAAAMLRPGGRLVYATCSLEVEEGENQIRRFLLANPDFRIEPVTAGEVGVDPAAISSEGYLRVLPSHHADVDGTDGFFAARLRRKA